MSALAAELLVLDGDLDLVDARVGRWLRDNVVVVGQALTKAGRRDLLAAAAATARAAQAERNNLGVLANKNKTVEDSTEGPVT